MRSLSQLINEQLSTLVSQRMSINVQRLAYLKFAMADNKRDKGLKKMYDTLYKLTFDKDGHVRTNKELLDYLKQTMEDNLGDIPGLPSNNAIEAIDKKIKALDELDPKKLQIYIKEVEKEVSDSEAKASEKDKKVTLDKDISDKELMKKVSELIDKEGLSNILGLEKDRKMSEADKKKLKQKEDPIGKEEVENKKDKKEDTKKEEPEAAPAGEDTGSEETSSEEPSEDTGSEDTGGEEQGLDFGNGEEPSEDTGSEDTGSEDTGSEDTGSEDTGGEESGDDLDSQLANLSDEDLEDLESLEDEDFEDPDEIASTEDEEKAKNESLIDLSEFLIFEEGEMSKKEMKAMKKAQRKLKNRDQLSSFLRDNPGCSIAGLIGRKRSKNQMALLQKRIDDAPDGEEKEKLKKQKEALKLTSFDSRGKYIGDPLSRKAREKQLIKDGRISKDDLLSNEDRKQLRLDAKAFANTDEGKKYAIDSKRELKDTKLKIESGAEKRDVEDKAAEAARNKEEEKERKKQEKEDAKKEKEFQKEFDKEKRQEKREDRKNERRFKKEEKERKKQEEADKKEAEYQEWKKKKLAAQEGEPKEPAKEPEKDEFVDSGDGRQIRKRKKENGDGYTYVWIKDGKEEGYATEEDYRRAQQRKNGN